IVCIFVVLTWWDLGRVRRTTKNRGHHRGAAAPGASVPWRTRFVVVDAPSEPQGPCLPAGPPELLLRFLGEVAVHSGNLTHIPESMQPFRPRPLAGRPWLRHGQTYEASPNAESFSLDGTK